MAAPVDRRTPTPPPMTPHPVPAKTPEVDSHRTFLDSLRDFASGIIPKSTPTPTPDVSRKPGIGTKGAGGGIVSRADDIIGKD